MNTVIPVIAVPPEGSAASASGTPSACGHCLHSSGGPVCHVEAHLPVSDEPLLSGPPDLLAQVLQALDAALALVSHDDGSPLAVSRSGLVQSLHLSDGEATLVLAVAPRCGGAQLAQTAFQTLRQLLPNTDIYVRHAVS